MVVNLGYNGTLHEIELLGEDVTVIVPETSPLLVEVTTEEGVWRGTNKLYYKQEDEEAHEMLEVDDGETTSYSIPVTYLNSGKVTLALFDTDTEQMTNMVTVMLRKVPVSDPEDEDPVFLLDNSVRRMIIPGSQPILAIQYDSQSEIVEFKFPRWQDGVDLGSKTPYINYKRPKADDLGKAQCIIDVVKTNSEYVYFYWVVDEYATAFEGILEFQVEFTDQYGYRWQSQIGTLPILTSLYNTGLEPYAPTFLEDMLQRMQNIGLDAEAYAVGTRGGEDVESTDPAYHNNSKYYAEQAATFITLTRYDGEDYPDKTSAQIYSALQNGNVNFILVDSSGRKCIMVDPPDNETTGRAKFATIKEDGSQIIIYTFAAGSSTSYVNADTVPIGSTAANAVTYSAQTGKTDAEKAQARANINASAEPTVVTLTGSTPVISQAQDNTIYEAGELTSLTIQSIASGASFIVRFSSPAGTPTVLTMPNRVYMPSGFSVAAYGRCEINVVGDYAVAMFWPFDE